MSYAALKIKILVHHTKKPHMDIGLDQTLVLNLIWFFIGFGAGLALLKFWKVVVAVVLVAVFLPFVVSLAGISAPFTSDQALIALYRGIEMFAGILTANPYSTLGFILGLVLGLVIFILRGR